MKKLSEKYPSRLKSKESHNVRVTTQNNDIDESLLIDWKKRKKIEETNHIVGFICQSLDILKIILALE